MFFTSAQSVSKMLPTDSPDAGSNTRIEQLGADFFFLNPTNGVGLKYL